MIVRKRNINPNSLDVQLHLSFGAPDIKEWVRMYVRIVFRSPEYLAERRAWTMSESDLRYWMEHDPHILGNYEEPWKSQLSQWAFRRMIALGYFSQSGKNDSEYLLTEKSVKLVDYRKANIYDYARAR